MTIDRFVAPTPTPEAGEGAVPVRGTLDRRPSFAFPRPAEGGTVPFDAGPGCTAEVEYRDSP